jgi:hypothetical protein
VHLLWDATVEITFLVHTHLSAMNWSFISGQTGLSVVKASTSDMKHVSDYLSVHLHNKNALL